MRDYLSTGAAVGGTVVSFAAILRWLIVQALSPSLQALHRRIDDHMTIEEREAAENRALQVQLSEHMRATSDYVARLDKLVQRIEERLARLEQQVARIDGKMEQP